jgi:hypothetical protein
MSTHYCSACDCDQGFNHSWFVARTSQSLGFECAPVGTRLGTSHPINVAFACGKGSALILFERWLDTGSFDPPRSTTASPAHDYAELT